MAGDSEEEREGPGRTKVVYCKVCMLPIEYCEFQPSFEKCKAALVKDWTTYFPDVTAEDEIVKLMTVLGFEGEPDDAAKKARGKRPEPAEAVVEAQPASALEGAPAADGSSVGTAAATGGGGGGKKKGGAKELAQVVITITQRNKRKHITAVTGLEAHGVKLAEASKAFGKKFASGASVVKGANGGSDSIEIQGEFKEPLAELMVAQFGIPKASVFFQDAGKKEPMF